MFTYLNYRSQYNFNIFPNFYNKPAYCKLLKFLLLMIAIDGEGKR